MSQWFIAYLAEGVSQEGLGPEGYSPPHSGIRPSPDHQVDDDEIDGALRRALRRRSSGRARRRNVVIHDPVSERVLAESLDGASRLDMTVATDLSDTIEPRAYAASPARGIPCGSAVSGLDAAASGQGKSPDRSGDSRQAIFHAINRDMARQIMQEYASLIASAFLTQFGCDGTAAVPLRL